MEKILNDNKKMPSASEKASHMFLNKSAAHHVPLKLKSPYPLPSEAPLPSCNTDKS